MKKRRMLRKFLLMLSSALLLVSLTVGATLAYLTDYEAVTNTFTVGKVGLSMDEAEVDVYGAKVAQEEGKEVRTDKNTYKLLPGHTYVKDPTVYIDEDSENGWLFVKIDNQIAAIEDRANSIASQMANNWTLIDEANGIYAYNSVVSANQEIEVFQSFTIAGSVDNTTLNGYEGKQVVVTAYLVQKDGFNTAQEAWNATFGKPAVPPTESPDTGD